MQITAITPNEEIMLTCSQILDVLYSESDQSTRDEGNDLIDDDRSQFFGYMGEITDAGLFDLYKIKTGLYECGEETGHFSEFKSARIIRDYVQFSGYIDAIDTECNIEMGKIRTSKFSSLVYDIETIHIQERVYQVSFKLHLEDVSEFMYLKDQ